MAEESLTAPAVPPDHTALLVVGAGPYGVSVAAQAREHGIDTAVVGRPMSFWTEHMPEGMFLRSGTDWHLDAAGVHTFEAYLEERGVRPLEVDPVPLRTFLDYAEWFQQQKRVRVRDAVVTGLERREDRFCATFEDGSELSADAVVAAPGVYHFRHLPEWAAQLPPGIGAHTADLVRFEQVAGSRVLVVGGRQSAYEWAALLAEHGAAQVDVVHRHEMPRFERVSWAFVDEFVDATVHIHGWWRTLSEGERHAISRRFWEVGRLTLEWWLTPRLDAARVRRWPGTVVSRVDTSARHAAVTLSLSNGQRLEVDLVVFASGYQADVTRVPYLRGLQRELELADGYPVLNEAFQSSVAALYFPGFVSTRDFGPFFGFTKGCPAAAALIVDDLLRSR